MCRELTGRYFIIPWMSYHILCQSVSHECLIISSVKVYPMNALSYPLSKCIPWMPYHILCQSVSHECPIISSVKVYPMNVLSYPLSKWFIQNIWIILRILGFMKKKDFRYHWAERGGGGEGGGSWMIWRNNHDVSIWL